MEGAISGRQSGRRGINGSVVPELGTEAIAFAILPLLFAILLRCIHKSLQGLGIVQETPGAKLKPDVPESVEVYAETFSPGSGS